MSVKSQCVKGTDCFFHYHSFVAVMFFNAISGSRINGTLCSYFSNRHRVQTPTVVQILQYYKEKLWGQEKLKTSRILCSLAVNLEPIAAKRAAVKWAERQLEEVSSRKLESI